MNTNVFNNIAPQEHVSRRRALPIDTMIATAQRLDDRYYANKAAMDNLDIWASTLDLGGNDSYLKEQAIEEVRGTLKSIAENEGAYENASALVGGLATSIAKNHHLNTAVANQQERRKWEDWAEQQRAAGKNIYDLGDPNFRTVNEDGTVNHWSNSMEVGLNHGDKMYDVWKGYLKEEKYGANLPNIDDLDPNNPFVKIAKGSGIGNRQVLAKQAAAFEHYRTTDEYAQQMRILTANGGMDSETADEAIAHEFDKVGDGFKYYNSEDSYIGNPNFMSDYKKGQLQLRHDEIERKKAADAAKYNSTPLKRQGITQMQGVVPSISDGNRKINEAASEADRMLNTHYVNMGIHQLMNHNPDIKQGYDATLAKLSTDDGEMVDSLLKWAGLRAGGFNKDLGKNAYAVKQALGLDRKVDPAAMEVGTVTGEAVEYLPLEETFKVNGKDLSISQREQLLDDFNKLISFKEEVDFDNRFEEGVSTMQITDDEFTPDDAKTVRELEFSLQREDPKDYIIVPMNAPGSYASAEKVSQAIGSFDNIQFMGVTQGSEHSLPEIAIKDPDTGATYRLISKSQSGMDFTSKAIKSLGAAGEHMAMNYKWANTPVPYNGGVDIGTVNVSHDIDGGYVLDVTNEDIINRANDGKTTFDVFKNSLGKEFNIEAYKLFMSDSPYLSEDARAMYENVLTSPFKTTNKNIALDYANFMN